MRVTGQIHSLSAGSGGFTVRLQGCPLQCVGCGRPDTWSAQAGYALDADSLVQQALLSQPLWKGRGGVTVTGGEPLMQAPFVDAFFAGAQAAGMHTTLETSGAGRPGMAERLLRHTDLVLCSLKFITPADYRRYCHGDMNQVEQFLRLTAFKGVPLRIRHTVIPGLTDSLEHMRLVRDRAQRLPNLERFDFVPYCRPDSGAYHCLGLEPPLPDTPDMDAAWLKQLTKKL
jgi:pyruvate formate lyase activating enzyme